MRRLLRTQLQILGQAATTVKKDAPKLPKCSGDLLSKRLTPRIAHMLVATSMMKNALDTGTTAEPRALMISRTDARRFDTRTTRNTRMIRITV